MKFSYYYILVVFLFFSCTKDDKKDIEKFIVEFRTGEGTSVRSQSVLKGELAVEPKEPARNGYDFSGWYKDDKTFKNKFDFEREAINSKLVLYAKWEKSLIVDGKVVFIVEFKTGGGATLVKSQYIQKGKMLIEPKEPTRKGYDFSGWYKDDKTFKNKFDFENEVISSKLILYAKWEKVIPDRFLVKIKSEGVLIGTVFVKKGTKLLEPNAPTKKDHKFVGWYDDLSSRFDFQKPITADLTINAMFAPIKIEKLKFDIEQVNYNNNDTAYAYVSFLDANKSSYEYHLYTAYQPGLKHDLEQNKKLFGFREFKSKNKYIKLKDFYPADDFDLFGKHRLYFMVVAKDSKGKIVNISNQDYVYTIIMKKDTYTSDFLNIFIPYERPVFGLVQMRANIKFQCPYDYRASGSPKVFSGNMYFSWHLLYDHKSYENLDLKYSKSYTGRIKTKMLLYCKDPYKYIYFPLLFKEHAASSLEITVKPFKSYVFIGTGNGEQGSLKSETLDLDYYNKKNSRKLTKDNFRFKVLVYIKR